MHTSLTLITVIYFFFPVESISDLVSTLALPTSSSTGMHAPDNTVRLEFDVESLTRCGLSVEQLKRVIPKSKALLDVELSLPALRKCTLDVMFLFHCIIECVHVYGGVNLLL